MSTNRSILIIHPSIDTSYLEFIHSYTIHRLNREWKIMWINENDATPNHIADFSDVIHLGYNRPKVPDSIKSQVRQHDLTLNLHHRLIQARPQDYFVKIRLPSNLDTSTSQLLVQLSNLSLNGDMEFLNLVFWGETNLDQLPLGIFRNLGSKNIPANIEITLAAAPPGIQNSSKYLHTLTQNPGEPYSRDSTFRDLSELTKLLEQYQQSVTQETIQNNHAVRANYISDNILISLESTDMHTLKPKPRLLFLSGPHDINAPHLIHGLIRPLEKALAFQFELIIEPCQGNLQLLQIKHQPDMILVDSGLENVNFDIPQLSGLDSPLNIPIGFYQRLDLHSPYMPICQEFIRKLKPNVIFNYSFRAQESNSVDKLKTIYVPNMFDPDFFYDYGLDKDIPLGLYGEGFFSRNAYPWRRGVTSQIASEFQFFHSPRPTLGRKHGTVGESLGRLTNRTQICLGCGGARKIPVRKLFEIPGARSCLVCEEMEILKELGFKHGVNCVFVTPQNVNETIRFLLDNPERLQKITNDGYHFVHNSHTWKNRNQFREWFDLYQQYGSVVQIIQESCMEPLRVLKPSERQERFVALDSTPVHQALENGCNFLATANYSDAINEFTICTNHYESMPEPCLGKGIALLCTGKHPEAYECMRLPWMVLLRKTPNWVDPLSWIYWIIATGLLKGMAHAQHIAMQTSPGTNELFDWFLKVLNVTPENTTQAFCLPQTIYESLALPIAEEKKRILEIVSQILQNPAQVEMHHEIKKRNMVYITFGEDITTSGIIRNQVFPLLGRMQLEGFHPTLISIIRADFQPNIERLSKTRMQLAKQNIDFVLLRETENMDKTTTVLISIYENIKPILAHCRSYHAALYAGLAKRSTGVPYIFDLRGRMPEEQKFVRDHNRGYPLPVGSDTIYESEKRMENALLADADVSVVLNEGFAKSLRNGNATIIRRLEIVQSFVDINAFKFSSEKRHAIRKQEGWNSKPIIGFSGALSPWYDFEVLASWAAAIQMRVPECQILVLSYIDDSCKVTKEQLYFQQLFSRHGIKPDSYHFRNAEAHEVSQWLSAIDIGIISLKHYFYDTQHFAQPIKLGEYLACGLPFIGNSWGTELSRLTNSYPNSGWVLPDQSIPNEALNSISNYLQKSEPEKESMRRNIQEVAKECYSIELVSNKYLALYNDLSAKSVLSNDAAVSLTAEKHANPLLVLFSHFDASASLPSYVRFALNALQSENRTIVLLTNKRKLSSFTHSFLAQRKIELIQYDNEGYDFGMWYKYLCSHNMESQQRLMLINDSIVFYRNIFPEFISWAENQEADLCGLTTNDQPEYQIPLHMQSFLLYLKGPAVLAAVDQIKAKGIFQNIQDVIHQHEIGLSQHLLSKGFKIKPMYPYRNYPNAMRMYKELAEEGSGFIKKKMLTKKYTEPEMQWLSHIGYADYVQFDYRKMLIDKNLLADGFRPEDLP